MSRDTNKQIGGLGGMLKLCSQLFNFLLQLHKILYTMRIFLNNILCDVPEHCVIMSFSQVKMKTDLIINTQIVQFTIFKYIGVSSIGVNTAVQFGPTEI